VGVPSHLTTGLWKHCKVAHWGLVMPGKRSGQNGFEAFRRPDLGKWSLTDF